MSSVQSSSACRRLISHAPLAFAASGVSWRLTAMCRNGCFGRRGACAVWRVALPLLPSGATMELGGSPFPTASGVGTPSPASPSSTLFRFYSSSFEKVLSRLLECADFGVHELDEVMDIRRLNNMMSDHGIYSRDRLLIPISKPDLLLDATCFIELDAYAKREAAVLYLEGGPDGKGGYLGTAITERGKRRILDSVKRSMQVDEGTAEYYLSISNGNPRAAILQFSEDLSWEQQRTSA